MKKNTFFKWSWIFFLTFFILGILNTYFALLGLICIINPIVISSFGHGRKNCSHFCPRGSFLHNFMEKISLNNSIPKFMLKKWFKNLVVVLLFTSFTISLYFSKGNIYQIAFSIFRMVVITTLISILLGIIYKPRTWCAICPMGHLSGEITKYKNRKEK